MEQVSDFLKVEGPERRVLWTKQMLRSIDPEVDITKIVGGNWTFIFGDVQYIPGTKKRAYGWFKPKAHRLRIRHGMEDARNLTKVETLYTEVHEWAGHGGDYTRLRMDQREAVLKKMGLGPTITKVQNDLSLSLGKAIRYVWIRGDKRTTPAQVPYWERPYEAYCDMLVSAISVLPSLFEKKYTWNIGEADLKKILLAPPPVVAPPPDPDPEPAPEPDPNPEPPDPCADIFPPE